MRIKRGLLHGLFQTVKNKVKIFFLTLIKNTVYHIYYSVKNERERNTKRDYSYVNNN